MPADYDLFYYSPSTVLRSYIDFFDIKYRQTLVLFYLSTPEYIFIKSLVAMNYAYVIRNYEVYI